MTKTNGLRLAIVGAGAVVETAIMPALRRIGWRPAVRINPSLHRIAENCSGRIAPASADWQSVADEFDAAIVALSPPVHSSTATALLAAGKHILLEAVRAVERTTCDERGSGQQERNPIA